MNKKPLTTGRVAEYCHVTYRTVLKWIEKGKLQSYQTPGGHHRVQVEDFLRFLKKHNMPIPSMETGPVTQRKKILIVDDNKSMVNSIKRILKIEDRYQIDAAFNGFEAGGKLLEFHPHLVVLDIRMPGMDGYEVIKKIKGTTEGKRIKIIAISAYFKEGDRKKTLLAGADVCLDKPFRPKRLLQEVNKLLGIKD